jgi:ectoine hydroxylase-related dioxygenase (phytanoyl-CoA dioxygenase family)
MGCGLVTDVQRATWERDGFFRIDAFADAAVGEAMEAEVVALARAAAAHDDVDGALVLPEQQADMADVATPEDRLSKIFLLARRPVFRDFVTDPRLTAIVAELVGTDDLDCFLSQFIFKNPGAWGQPWHQDSYYFPFDPPRPVVGVWLAVTEATIDNGCLHVLPGSHREPVHDHVPDRREGANYGYVEIVDHDLASSEPVLMAPGDLLVFDSHLMHRSTDNRSSGRRAAMVFHLAAAGTLDRTLELRGYTVNDWMPARRADGSLA